MYEITSGEELPTRITPRRKLKVFIIPSSTTSLLTGTLSSMTIAVLVPLTQDVGTVAARMLNSIQTKTTTATCAGLLFLMMIRPRKTIVTPTWGRDVIHPIGIWSSTLLRVIPDGSLSGSRHEGSQRREHHDVGLYVSTVIWLACTYASIGT